MTKLPQYRITLQYDRVPRVKDVKDPADLCRGAILVKGPPSTGGIETSVSFYCDFYHMLMLYADHVRNADSVLDLKGNCRYDFCIGGVSGEWSPEHIEGFKTDPEKICELLSSPKDVTINEVKND